MIYRDGMRLEREDLQEQIQILKGKFPTFFRSENPLPVTIDYLPSQKFYVDLYRPGGESSAGRVLKAPQPTNVFSIGYEIEDGFRTEVRYSEVPPVIKGNDLSWKSSKMTLSSGMNLNPIVDLEKLIFLWFYSDNFANNDCQNKRKNARFEFIIPEVQVEHKYTSIKERRRLEDEVLIEETRMSYDMVKSICKLMDLKLRGEEKSDRITLFDYLINAPHKIGNYDAIKGNMVVDKPSTVDAVVGLTQIKNLVANAVENLKLFEDESVNKWRIKAPGKAKYLCDIEGDTDEAKLFNLVEFVSNNPEAFEIVKGLIK
jgi:hypothetical protein